MDLISVVVPVYNVEKYLNRCVESIVNQTYKNLEIILVDDGSTDSSPAICDEWAQKDNRIKVIHKKNGGLSSARNAGIKALTGKYVCFIDSDDYIEINTFELMLKSITKDDYDVCICSANLVDKDYNIISKENYKSSTFSGEEVMKAFLTGKVFESISACDKLYKVSVIRNNNITFNEEEKWGEDFPFNYLYFKKVDKLISIDDRLYNYLTKRNGSITNGITYGKVMRWENNYKPILLNERNNYGNYIIALEKYAQELMKCCRELLQSRNAQLINNCYQKIVEEIKHHRNEFLSLKDLSIILKLSIIIISISPQLFKTFYLIYKKLI